MFWIFALCTLWTSLTSAVVVSYPRPPIYNESAEYSVKVNGVPINTTSYAGYDYVQLSMTEGISTEFRITAMTETAITSYNVSPKKLSIKAATHGNELVFNVVKAYYLIVKINSVKELVILADPTEINIPSPAGTGVYNVLNYGADNTGAGITIGIQAAMDAAGRVPGSIVYVPPGVYYIGNLLLRNHTSLYLAGGAVLRFTGKQSDYTALFNKAGVADCTWWIQTEFNSSNIQVYGRGIIDGNGYYSLNSGHFIADLLVAAGTDSFIYDGPIVRDSSFWAVMPVQSTNVDFKNIKVLNRLDVGQDDGIDVIESTGVRVTRAIAIALDDSFSTKTWAYKNGSTIPYPYPPRTLNDVVFDDCLAWSECYGYKVGQGVWEDQTGVTFKNSVVYSAAVGIGLDHREGIATVRDLTFDNIDIESLSGENAGHATWVAFFIEAAGGVGVGPVTGINVKNMRVRDEGMYNGTLEGYNSSSILSHITFENVYMLANTTPAISLQQMKILDVNNYTSDIVVLP